MKMSKMKKLLCCVGVFAFATVGGVMAMPTAETVDVKADSSSFTMLGGSIRLNATTPGIRFQASISDDYYQAIVNPEIIEKAKAEHKKNCPDGYICPTDPAFMPDLEG